MTASLSLQKEKLFDDIVPGSREDENMLRDGIYCANIPTLLLVLVQLTGDLCWLEPPYQPKRGIGIDDNDSGGFAQNIQDEIREQAYAAILAWRSGSPPALVNPEPELLRRMIATSMAEEVPENYGALVAANFARKAPKPNSKSWSGMPKAGFKAVIIGAGVSGIYTALRLQELGIEAEMIEKEADFGGTWRDNNYPGAGVDTPNHIYAFSFAKYDWPDYFALRDEIFDYLKSVADEYRLRKQARFNTKVERTIFDATQNCWQIEIRNDAGKQEILEADFLFSAVGILNIPKIPAIPGLEDFPKPAFHTTQWPENLDLSDKHVAIVGNGASAMQIVPEIADKVKHLTIFARSKQWAAPFPQFRKPMPLALRYLIREVPLYHAWYRQRLSWTFNDRIHKSLQKDADWHAPERSLNAANDRHRAILTRHIIDELGERQDLLPHVLPDYPPFGKRMLMDNGWFRTLTKTNVTLIPHYLAHIEGDELIAENGAKIKPDLLVLATGFKASEMLSSYEIVGLDNQKLSQVWEKDNPRAYMGSFIPGFPNFVTLAGPNTGLGHGGSMIVALENQIDYVFRVIEFLFQKGGHRLCVKQEAYESYNSKVDAAHNNMVWSHRGMENWYRNSRGRVVAPTPWRNDDFWWMTQNPVYDDFIYDYG